MSSDGLRPRKSKVERVLSLALMAALPLMVGGHSLSLDDDARQISSGKGASCFVDSKAGDDGFNGTSVATAWKSLDKVNATSFHPGDRVLFKSGGDWTGQLWPKGSGTAENPIVVDKYGGEALPVINTSGTAEDAVLLKNQEYWEIRDLEITNTGAAPG